MKLYQLMFAAAVSTATISSCTNSPNKDTISMEEKAVSTNPLLQDWVGENGGFPLFETVKVEHFIPAFDSAMKVQELEINQITENKEPATFENTIVAYEKSGDLFRKILPYYSVWSLNMTDSAFQEAESIIDPQLSALSDRIWQNKQFFKRVETVKFSEESKSFTTEQSRLVDVLYQKFLKIGVKLSSDSKQKVTEINKRLSVLYSDFSKNLLADESEKYLLLETEEQLKGLPQPLINAASETANKKGENGKWIISNTRSSIDPFLTFAENREAREKAWKLFISRGDNGDKNDNNKIVEEIIQLRQQKAKLMGYQSYAHLQTHNTMAQTPENAMSLMIQAWDPAVKRVAEEVAAMQTVADKESANITIQPWDYHFYSEKVRKEQFDIDQNEVKQYLQLDKLREGMFWVADELFDLSFTPFTEAQVFHEDVSVWKVTNKSNNIVMGYWFFDPYAREGKRSGAWMTSWRDQFNIDAPNYSIVTNNSNFVKGKEGEPVLISWDDAETLFHEFGHALHGLCSNVTYPTLSGTSVVRDYVEFPSQVLEQWLKSEVVLKKFALHYKTGEPMPDELIAKLHKAGTFKEGFKTTEYLASGIVDMKLHLSHQDSIVASEFETKALAEIGMPKELVMRHRLPQFSHLFSSYAYSANYYSYLWAEVLALDAFEAFSEKGDLFDKEVAGKLKEYVFSKGNSIEPSEAYKLFRGKDPNTDALMKSKGFL